MTDLMNSPDFIDIAKKSVQPRYQHGHAFIHGLLHAGVPGCSFLSSLVPAPVEFSPWVPSAAAEEVSRAFQPGC